MTCRLHIRGQRAALDTWRGRSRVVPGTCRQMVGQASSWLLADKLMDWRSRKRSRLRAGKWELWSAEQQPDGDGGCDSAAAKGSMPVAVAGRRGGGTCVSLFMGRAG